MNDDFMKLETLKSLPSENPCNGCAGFPSCLGICDEQQKYYQAWRPYIDEGMLKIANNILAYDKIKSEIVRLSTELKKLRCWIPDEYLPTEEE